MHSAGYQEFETWLKKEWPETPYTALGRLLHTLDVYDSPLIDSVPDDDAIAIQATGGMYVDAKNLRTVKTGLTWGDLRKIRRYLEHQLDEYEAEPIRSLIQVENSGVDRPKLR